MKITTKKVDAYDDDKNKKKLLFCKKSKKKLKNVIPYISMYNVIILVYFFGLLYSKSS